MVRETRRTAYLGLLILALLLSGCTISSGLNWASSSAPSGGGNLRVSFVTSDSLGSASEELLQVGQGRTQLDVICTVSLQRGQLKVEILKPDGSVALSVAGKAQHEQVGSVRVSSDDQGRLRYRITATEAKQGHYQIIYRPIVEQ